MNISGIGRRTERVGIRLELNSDQRPRNILINVHYYNAVDTAQGPRDVPVPAEYAPVHWEKIEPNSGGDRIAVCWPVQDYFEPG